MIRQKGRAVRSPLQHPDFQKLDFQSKMTVQLLEAHKSFLGAVKDYNESVKGHTSIAQKVLETATELRQHMSRINSLPKGDTPVIDVEAIVRNVLAKLPKPEKGEPGKDAQVDEEKIAKKVLSRIRLPKDGKDAVVDHDQLASSVIDKIIEGKMLKMGSVDGLEETLTSYKRQVSRSAGYVHGGGDTVAAGAGVSITNIDGTKVISATGTTSTNVYNEVVSGSGTTWVLAHTPVDGSLQLYANGQRLTPGVDYSISGANITTTDSWAAGTILADYSY